MLGELLSKFAHEVLKALSREVTTRKHVVAAGIAKVVFLEPYPKSLTANLHGGSVRIEGADRGRHQSYPAVEFAHFHGISHLRYRELFERGRRKDADGKFMERTNPAVDETVTPSQIHPRPIIDIKFPFYLELEKKFIVTGVRAAALAGLAITPLSASALIAGLRILGVEGGLPRLPDLEFAIYEKARPEKASAALVAVLLTLAQGPSRPAI